MSTPAATIYTIGHSTRPIDQFLAILEAQRIRAIADVRQFPRSRRYPHFNDDALAVSLASAGIEYLPFKSLGGRRKTRPDSPNTGWRHPAFRGYADFMQTPQFAQALEELIAEAQRRPTAIMCAEAVPWRCHRSLISDALLVRGWNVMDIYDAKSVKPHELTKFAHVEGTTITYPPEDAPLFG